MSKLGKTEEALLVRLAESRSGEVWVEVGSYRIGRGYRRYRYGKREFRAANKLIARGLVREVRRDGFNDCSGQSGVSLLIGTLVQVTA